MTDATVFSQIPQLFFLGGIDRQTCSHVAFMVSIEYIDVASFGGVRCDIGVAGQ